MIGSKLLPRPASFYATLKPLSYFYVNHYRKVSQGRLYSTYQSEKGRLASTMAKPLRVWVSPPGSNSWKVIFILEELGIPYETISLRFENIKKKPYTDINPNGRVPAIEDPNTDITVWETGAIIQYLIAKYDTAHHLSYDTFKEQTLCNQWLMFQVSGQGPYYGQCTWFTYLHKEKIPSAIERYSNEVRRVLGVLEGVLAAKPEPRWLVGDRMTFADMAFVPWNNRLETILSVPIENKWDGFPHVKAWHESMNSRPSWIRAMDLRTRLMDEQGLDWNGMPKGTKSFDEFQKSFENKDDAAEKA